MVRWTYLSAVHRGHVLHVSIHMLASLVALVVLPCHSADSVQSGVVREPLDRWQVRFSGSMSAFSGSIVYPIPPDDPGQSVLSYRMTARASGRTVEARRITDSSRLAQPVLIIDVPNPSRVEVEVEVVAQLFGTRLGDPGKAPALAPEHRQVYLDCRWDKREDREWFASYLDGSGLRRRPVESDIAFARRVLEAVAHDYTYRIPDGTPALQAAIRKDGEFGRWVYTIQTKSGECWRLSELYANILRTADIPVRVVSGNLLGQPGHHLRTLVWLEEYGWVPVEPTAAVVSKQPARFFGTCGDPMLNGNANIWLSVPTPNGTFNVGTMDVPWFFTSQTQFSNMGSSITSRRL